MSGGRAPRESKGSRIRRSEEGDMVRRSIAGLAQRAGYGATGSLAMAMAVALASVAPSARAADPAKAPAAASAAAKPDPAAAAKTVAEATAGRLTALAGKVFDEACGSEVDYQADAIDLNGDGQPEVFTQLQSGCYGMAGVQLDLLIKGKDGKWKSQFGFPGMYTVLETRHLGWPDIEIGGPGDCFPIWRWSGAQYDLHKKCGG